MVLPPSLRAKRWPRGAVRGWAFGRVTCGDGEGEMQVHLAGEVVAWHAHLDVFG